MATSRVQLKGLSRFAQDQGISVDAREIEELRRSLNRLERTEVAKIVQEATLAAAHVVLPEARRRALAVTNPENKTERMRVLAEGLSVQAIRRRKGRIGAVVFAPVRDDLDIPANSKWYYPIHVELGAPKRTPPLAAIPWMRPAVDATAPEAFRKVVDTMWNGIVAALRKRGDAASLKDADWIGVIRQEVAA